VDTIVVRGADAAVDSSWDVSSVPILPTAQPRRDSDGEITFRNIISDILSWAEF
jgi:hypothetical protein